MGRLPGEADEYWACRAVIVLWLVEEILDVLADGCKISLGAHSCCCVVFGFSWMCIVSLAICIKASS